VNRPKLTAIAIPDKEIAIGMDRAMGPNAFALGAELSILQRQTNCTATRQRAVKTEPWGLASKRRTADANSNQNGPNGEYSQMRAINGGSSEDSSAAAMAALRHTIRRESGAAAGSSPAAGTQLFAPICTHAHTH
jgi:hypothetical protein